MAIEIRRAQTKSDFEAVFRLRYEVYVEELGRVQRYADHQARTIVEPLDASGRIFCAVENGTLVGTLRTNYARDSVAEYEWLYSMSAVGDDHPQATSVSTKLLVVPKYRNSTLGYRLAAAGYAANLAAGIEHDFADVYPARVPFFTRLGYRVHKDRVEHPEYGNVIVMRLGMRDEEHLRLVKSPFLQHLMRRVKTAA
jgi:hypothetical protein